MKKTRKFDYSRVEVCRECKGTGKKAVGDYSTFPVYGICPVCNGSGHVVRRAEGTVTVEPYKMKAL